MRPRFNSFNLIFVCTRRLVVIHISRRDECGYCFFLIQRGGTKQRENRVSYIEMCEATKSKYIRLKEMRLYLAKGSTRFNLIGLNICIKHVDLGRNACEANIYKCISYIPLKRFSMTCIFGYLICGVNV